jgi:hypothetical protein
VKREVPPETPPVASADQAAQLARLPEAEQSASSAQFPDASAALAKGLDSGAQAFQALSQDPVNVNAGKPTESQLDERSRAVHGPYLRRVMQFLAKAKFPTGDPRAAVANDYTRLVELVREELKTLQIMTSPK